MKLNATPSTKLAHFFDCAQLGIEDADIPAIAGRYVGKRIVIVGGARCVWEDLRNLGVCGGDNNGWDVMTVNDVTMHYPGRIEHLYTNNSMMTLGWLAARRHEFVRQFGQPKHVHSCRHETYAEWAWPWRGYGTSALGAVYGALGLGYDRIVLCGVPLDDTGHYFDPPWPVFFDGFEVRQSSFTYEVPTREELGGVAFWQSAAKAFRGKVSSMSGRTRDVLGAP